MTKAEIITIGISSVVTGFAIYQYSKAIKDYNELLDRNICMSNFIRDHDFYEKSKVDYKKSKTEVTRDEKPAGRYQEVGKEDLGNGYTRVVILDTVSGFECVSVKKTEELKNEKDKEA